MINKKQLLIILALACSLSYVTAAQEPRVKSHKVLTKSKIKKAKKKTAIQGQQQSPIDLGKAFPVNLTDIKFNYNPVQISITNLGHALQVAPQPGQPANSIVVDGKQYNLIQFHFHTPSEHSFKGRRFDMEVHFVHKNAAGNLAVIGVLVQKGERHKIYHKIFKTLPIAEHESAELPDPIDLLSLFPSDKRFYRYDGSLTTEPYTEGIKWFVIKEPIQMSQDMIEKHKHILHGPNSREEQPRNNRTVLFDCCSDDTIEQGLKESTAAAQ